MAYPVATLESRTAPQQENEHDPQPWFAHLAARLRGAFGALLASLSMLLVAGPAAAQQVLCSRSYDDTALRVSINSVRAFGSFVIQLGQLGDASGTEGYVRKLDLEGRVIWTSQLSVDVGTRAYAAAADDSGVYVVGIAEDASGSQRAWVARLDALPTDDFIGDIGVDPSGVYMLANGSRIEKYNAAGQLLWQRS
jgi:hypothetical protein